MSKIANVRVSVCLCLFVASVTVGACAGVDDTTDQLHDAVVADFAVETNVGRVVGVEAHGVRAFLGIPYAAAPVGALRWKAPQETHWRIPRVAGSFGPRCFGVSLLDPSVVRGDASEDCLSLNIWSPAGAFLKPVLVNIHGGGNIDGTSGDGPGGGYPGAALAKAGDIIVVTINYRLGALGTLAIPSADGGGNLGLLDQQFALRWVRRNIAAFGGDPSKITIAGQSAGAQAACLQAAIPSSRGLFHALVLESPSCDSTQTADLAAATAFGLAQSWGCAITTDAGVTIDERCLRALPADTVVRGNQLFEVLPIVDGNFLPASPRAAMAAGTFARVPMLVGFTAQEGLFFTDGPFGALALASASDYEAAMQFLYGPLAPAVENEYPLSQHDGDARAAVAASYGDLVFECPSRRLMASSRAPVFAYRFDHAPALDAPKPVLAMHTVELPYVWGAPLPWTWWAQARAGVPTTAQELELARQIKGYWTSFVRAERPGEPGLPAWPRWSEASHRAMIFGDSARAAELAANAHCAFWDSLFGGS